MLVDRHVTCPASQAQSQRPALLQAAAETTGKEDLKAACRVRLCKEVGLQEWLLAGRATIPCVLYGIGLRMSLRRRTILSQSLQAPARVALTIHTFRTVDRTAGRRFDREEVRIWSQSRGLESLFCQYAPPHSCCSLGTAEAKRCMPAPRRLHWMASDVIDAEFALRRCQCVYLSSTQRMFFAFAPISSLKT